MSIGSFRNQLATLKSDQLALHLSQASAVSMVVRVIGLGLAFLSHLFLSRALGANQYGAYVIALSWAMVLVIPARLGLDNSVLRFATVYREEGKAADFRGLVLFSVACITALSAGIAAILLLAKVAEAPPLRSIEWSLLIGVALLVPFLAMLGWLSALIRTANRIFASQFYEQVVRPALLISAVVILALVGVKVSAANAMLITSATVGAAMAGIALHARVVFGRMPYAHPEFEHRREWLSVSWVLFLMAVVQELLNQVDIILLGIVGTATEAAHFAAAWRLASLVIFGLVAIVSVSGPLIASAYNRGDTDELARIARFNARLSLLFAGGLAVLLVLFGRTALALFGPGFSDAYPALVILLAGGLVNSFTGSVGYLLMMTGHQRDAVRMLAGALLVSVVANVLLIPRLGATGAALASSVGTASWNLAMAVYVRRKLGVDATALGIPARVVA